MGGVLVDKSVGPPARQWQVLLLGGPSGVGKTAVSYRLAHHFGVGITEVDDFQVLLERMTTVEQQPAIHFWRTHPSPDQLSAAEILQHLVKQGDAMTPGLEAVVANHLETSTPVVLEGDFLLPSLAAQTSFLGQANGGRVRGAFLHEPDEQQFVANYLSREPESGPQVKRANVSWRHGQWLRQEAERYGLPVVLARPWDTVLERLVAAVS
jgi:2-phosphoglycerate kinase